MATIKVDKTRDYTVMSNYHFKEKKMSLKAKGLLSMMLSLPDTWDYSIAGLVKLSKDGKDSVMAGLAELEKFGYLTRERKTNEKGQFSGIEYTIYEKPQLDNPIVEKEKADKANAADPQQLSKKGIKSSSKEEDTKESNTEDFEQVIASYVPYESLKDYYRNYIKMRESIGAPLTASGLLTLIQRCHRLTGHNINKQRIMLETATINGWKNVYSPHGEDTPSYVKENTIYNKLYDFYENS